jgi:hypothetical protein
MRVQLFLSPLFEGNLSFLRIRKATLRLPVDPAEVKMVPTEYEDSVSPNGPYSYSAARCCRVSEPVLSLLGTGVEVSRTPAWRLGSDAEADGTGAVAGWHKCGREWNQCGCASERMLSSPRPGADGFGTGAEGAGSIAVACWNGCCRVLRRLQLHSGSSAEARETRALTHQNVCRRLKNSALRSGELMRTYAVTRVGGLGTDC